MLDDRSIDDVHDPEARRVIGVLLNLVEE